jgi:hypothetical protein
LARIHPNAPDVTTPKKPLGVPKKCGTPKIIADIQQIELELNFPHNPATITNRLKISSDHAFAADKIITKGNKL